MACRRLYQAVICTNSGILLIETLETKLSETGGINSLFMLESAPENIVREMANTFRGVGAEMS